MQLGTPSSVSWTRAHPCRTARLATNPLLAILRAALSDVGQAPVAPAFCDPSAPSERLIHELDERLAAAGVTRPRTLSDLPTDMSAEPTVAAVGVTSPHVVRDEGARGWPEPGPAIGVVPTPGSAPGVLGEPALPEVDAAAVAAAPASVAAAPASQQARQEELRQATEVLRRQHDKEEADLNAVSPSTCVADGSPSRSSRRISRRSWRSKGACAWCSPTSTVRGSRPSTPASCASAYSSSSCCASSTRPCGMCCWRSPRTPTPALGAMVFPWCTTIPHPCPRSHTRVHDPTLALHCRVPLKDFH